MQWEAKKYHTVNNNDLFLRLNLIIWKKCCNFKHVTIIGNVSILFPNLLWHMICTSMRLPFQVTVVLSNMVSKFTEATGDFESPIMFHFCVICHIQLTYLFSFWRRDCVFIIYAEHRNMLLDKTSSTKINYHIHTFLAETLKNSLTKTTLPIHYV